MRRPDGVSVRPALAADLRSVSEVAAEGWRHAYRDLLSAAAINDALANWYSPEVMQRRLSAGGLEVACLRRRVVGYVQHASVGDGVHEVFAIYVLPAFLGRGAGWALWRRVLEAAGSAAVELWVLEGNRLGIEWYDRQGGVVVGRREVEFLDGAHVELRYRFATAG